MKSEVSKTCAEINFGGQRIVCSQSRIYTLVCELIGQLKRGVIDCLSIESCYY